MTPTRLVLAAALAGAALVGGPAPAPADAPSGNLPDLQTIIPTDSFSIAQGDDGPEFRYTHLVFNGGAGPLQIRPFYSRTAGTYLGRQEFTTYDGGGDDLTVVGSRPIGDAFVYHAEHGHFHFPLASFGLYKDVDGHPGAAVTMSPKIGFCIADSYIYDQQLPHAGAGHDQWGNCSDPTTMRGISVGGADEYDYRDPGQAVPMTGVPDGTYWFRAISDPNNDVVESDESNNEQDVRVRISHGTVTASTVLEPDTTPCTATLHGATTTVSGDVRLTTTASRTASKVQYLVDGTVVATSTGAAPYAATWRSTDVVDGTHWVTARVTAAGRVCTSPVVGVTADNRGGPGEGAPVVRFTDPEARSTVGGRVALAVNAADTEGIARVRFLLDGHWLGAARTRPPYSLTWNSRSTRPGWHTIGARATDTSGHSTTTSIRLRVVHQPRPQRVVRDASVVARGSGSLTSPAVTTRTRGQVLLALVAYDGPQGAEEQSATVSGGGLGWRLVKRSASQSGVSEIWTATARGRLRAVHVLATPRVTGYDGMLSVYSFRRAARVGVAAAAGAPSGAPDFYVPAVQEGSMVFAVGNDWDGAAARTPVRGQAVRRQWLDGQAGTFWVQALDVPTTAHRLITIRDTAPTDHQWNYVGAEVVARR